MGPFRMLALIWLLVLMPLYRRWELNVVSELWELKVAQFPCSIRTVQARVKVCHTNDLRSFAVSRRTECSCVSTLEAC